MAEARSTNIGETLAGAIVIAIMILTIAFFYSWVFFKS